MMGFEEHKMKNVFPLAAVVLVMTAANSVHAKTTCDSWKEESGCKIHVNCTGASESNVIEIIKDTVKSYSSCVHTSYTCCRYGDYYQYTEYGDSEIYLSFDYNLKELWGTDVLDSHIRTITFANFETVPKETKRLTNLKEIVITNSMNDTFDLSCFLGISSLFRINASTNSIKFIESNIDSNNGYAQIIDLSHNKIETLPNQCFSKFSALKSLNLSHNSIKSIEILTFEGISKLEVLDLSFNVLVEIDQSLVRFVNMKELYINNNNLNSISDSNFKTMSKLEKLYLNNNQLRSIGDEAFKTLTELEYLDLSNNSLETVNFETSDMEKLVSFNAKNNNILAFPKFMVKNVGSLVKLDMSDNKIVRLEPQNLLKAINLKYLDLSNNMIETAVTANFFEGLLEIVDIQLGQNKLKSLENEAFNGLNKLLIVNFSHCNIERVGHNAFKNTGSIHTIDLSYNSIHNFSLLPKSITEVRELSINNNKIQHISAEMFASLPNLEKFTIANNNLLNETVLLTSSKRMSYVDISNTKTDVRKFFNFITNISELSIANVKNNINFKQIYNKTVFKLDLSQNDIKNIDNVFIFNVQNLAWLDLRSNELTFINKFSFQNMPALTWLDLSSNSISQIEPGSFIHTNNITDLNLHGNSLKELKFGVFEGLQNLLTLNLSDNMIYEFSLNYLHSTPFLSKVVLDNNQIEDINLKDFIKSNISVISVGGNPLSCHLLASFKQYIDSKNHQKDISEGIIKNFTITAETLDYHSDNFYGVKCGSSFSLNESVTWPDLSTDINSTQTLLLLSKELKNTIIAIKTASKNITEKIENQNYNMTNLMKSIDADLNSNTKITSNSIEHLAKNITTTLNKNTDQLLEALTDHIKNVSSASKTDSVVKYVNVSDTGVVGQHLNEQLAVMDEEKERLVKELQTIFEDLKISSKIKTDAQLNETHNNDIKSVLYFEATCLAIMLMILCIIAYKMLRNSNLLKRNTIFNSSSQPIANAMELS